LKNSYDAWGRRRNPETWDYDTIPAPTLIDRGYTGQEHLDEFGLINMNGRMYDPYIGRFLSVDPFIQFPGNSQSFNGYSYCLNNPLSYTDPSGMLALSRDFDCSMFDMSG
jgi:RHS repeat-associated protein